MAAALGSTAPETFVELGESRGDAERQVGDSADPGLWGEANVDTSTQSLTRGVCETMML